MVHSAISNQKGVYMERFIKVKKGRGQERKERDRERVRQEDVRYMWYKSQEQYDKRSEYVQARQMRARKEDEKILHDVVSTVCNIMLLVQSGLLPQQH